MKRIDVSLVVSVYNEERSLPFFWEESLHELEELNCSWEIIFVNDGSTDSSLEILCGIVEETPSVRVVNLSRNFGHEAAMLAGIDHAHGNVVICLDADLQHPPGLIPEMIEAHRSGHKIVHMIRKESDGLSGLNKARSWLFYKLLNLISPEGFAVNASDFFLIDRKVCDLLRREFRERARFMRGIVQVVGFSKITIPFTAPSRVAGCSKYSILNLLNISITALVTFSHLPLRLGLLLGISCGFFSIAVGIYSIIMKIFGNVITGYTTIVVLVSFLFAVQLLILWIIGEYIGFIFAEVKQRPIYILESVAQKKDHELV